MFRAPRCIEAQVFSSLPEEHRVREGAVVRSGVTRHSLLEGPAFDSAGYLYCVDLPYGRIFKVAPDGSFQLFAKYDGEPNGLKILPNGSLLIAD